eukprot:3066614-Amphidinium_carterae.1
MAAAGVASVHLAPCPLAGRRAPELATGGFARIVEQLQMVSLAHVVEEHGGSAVLNLEQCLALSEDFQKAKTHIAFVIE